jgi:tetratricopeptide (TPR) repeat protein
MLGVEPSRLRYWERLRLVRPRARWGERFYSFGDLVALRTLQRLTERRVPALRVRRAVKLIEEQFGNSKQPLQEFQFLDEGRDVLVIPPGAARPFSPVKQQWVFPFDAAPSSKLHSMASPSPEQFFQAALDCETRPELLPQAIENYRHVLELSPGWVDAHINLGVALYQMGRSDEALAEFVCAVRLDPLNGISRYNLGCVLEERGDMDQAIEHLIRAALSMPAHADVHFNLALAYEKRGDRDLARDEWLVYLRLAPNGLWAGEARAHLKLCSEPPKRSAPIPFRRKTQ